MAALRYRPDIDGLRAVAVLLILIYHAQSTWMPGGFIGVDVFFVISGYLITQILLKDLEAGQFSILTFYGRRVRRIFPALIVVLAAVLIAGWFLLLPEEYKQVGKHVGGASLFFSNFMLKREIGYFDTQSELKPLLHLWSLAVEEQFYILWPWLLWLGWKLRRTAFFIAAGLIIGSLTLAILRTGPAPAFSFFLLPTRFWELAIGGALVWWQGRTKQTLPGWCGWLGVALIAVAAVGFDKTMPFPGWRALLPVLGAALLLGSASSRVHKTLLSNRLMVGIGKISYPLYLWHWPLFAFARIIVWQGPSPQLMVGLMALSVGLAWVTMKFIESPIRFGKWRGRAVSIPLIMLLVLLGGAGKLIDDGRGIPATRSVSNPMFGDLVRQEEFRKTTLPCPDAYGAKDMWCNIVREGEPTAAVFGDSHSNHLFAGLATDETRNWMLIGYSSCPPLLDIASRLKTNKDECLAVNRRAINILAQQSSVKLVVLSSLGSFYTGQNLAANHTGKLASQNWRLESSRADEKDLSKPELFYRGMDRTITALEAAGKKVVLFADVPEFDFFASACIPRASWLAKFAKNPCSIERARVEVTQKIYRDVLERLHAAHPNALLYDPRPTLCDADSCFAGRDGILLFHDSHHLSKRGSKIVVDDLLKALPAAPTPPSHTQ